MWMDINMWVKACAVCVSYNVWRNRQSELYLSWPITSQFYIIHADFWMHGKLIIENGETLQLMNCMSDLTQFVISILVSNATSEVLEKLFTE